MSLPSSFTPSAIHSTIYIYITPFIHPSIRDKSTGCRYDGMRISWGKGRWRERPTLHVGSKSSNEWNKRALDNIVCSSQKLLTTRPVEMWGKTGGWFAARLDGWLAFVSDRRRLNEKTRTNNFSYRETLFTHFLCLTIFFLANNCLRFKNDFSPLPSSSGAQPQFFQSECNPATSCWLLQSAVTSSSSLSIPIYCSRSTVYCIL